MSSSPNQVKFKFCDSAFDLRLQTFTISNHNHVNTKHFFHDAFHHFKENISKLLKNRKVIKVNASLVIQFDKVIKRDESETSINRIIQTKNLILDQFSDLNEIYDEFIVRYCLDHLDEMQIRGASFTRIIELIVNLNKYDPIRVSSYMELPKFLQFKNAIINVRNNDEKCFKWAILSALYPTSNAQRVAPYRQYEHSVNFNGLQFPFDPNDITKFEAQNPNISINVYEFDEKNKRIHPIRLTKTIQLNHIHLLLLTKQWISNGNVFKTNSHYCWIKDLGRLITSQVTKHSKRCFYCDRCLNHFIVQEKLINHREACMYQNVCEIKMPNESNNKIKFENKKKQLQVPFIIYADMKTLAPNSTEEEIIQIEKVSHVHSIGFYFKCLFDETKSFYRSERGPKCIEWFINELKNCSEIMLNILNTETPMKLTKKDKIDFKKSTKCHICEIEFKPNEYRVRDHSHTTGDYRGAAHNYCNLNHQESRTISIVFQNLSNYDSHFIQGQLAKGFDGKYSIISDNMENFISITKRVHKDDVDFKELMKFRFIDSFRFMAAPLDYLVSILPPGNNSNFQREFNRIGFNDEITSVFVEKTLLGHGVRILNEYLDSFDKLNEPSLPSRDSFYNQISKETISIEEYEFAKEIWNEFNVKTLGEYTDIYLRTDVLLLADVFEYFRKTCLNIYKLDPAHYVSAPSLSWDAMLKHTNVELELLTDIDQLLFVEKGIRGGISQCTKRYAKANNKHMSNYDENADSNYLIYLDCNNLYGHSMMQPLPIDGFKWSTDKFDTKKVLEHSDDDPIGYFLEVDLKYPNELHDKHNDFPFCGQTESPPNSKAKKLLLTLHDKKNYVIHYKMLKEALKHGLILEKVHRVLQFNQSKWLEPYILLNTQLQTEATNEFDKNVYKLLLDAVYRKIMENIRERFDIKLCNKWEGRKGVANMISNHRFKRRTILDEDLAIIEMEKTTVLIDEPISIGMAILDISKANIYKLHYDFIKQKYDENVEMLYINTDSFIYDIKTSCINTEDLDRFISENYGSTISNRKISGDHQNKSNSILINEFVGLRSKIFSVRSYDTSQQSTNGRGIEKFNEKLENSYNDHYDCLVNDLSIMKGQNSFESQAHQPFNDKTVSTVGQQHFTQSFADGKRCLLSDGIRTFAWGHYSLSTNP